MNKRRHQRSAAHLEAHWDFFGHPGGGPKVGYVENLSQGGCLVRTNEPIPHQRWVRLVLQSADNLLVTVVGRSTRQQNRMELWSNEDVTLHRQGLEFVQPLSPSLVQRLTTEPEICSHCGRPHASVPDPDQTGLLCILCHLRRNCADIAGDDAPHSA